MQPEEQNLNLDTLFAPGLSLADRKAFADEVLQRNHKAVGPLLTVSIRAVHSLLEKNVQLARTCAELSDTLKRGPHAVARFIRLLEGEPPLAVVKTQGRQAAVQLAPGLDVSSIARGQSVLLNAEGNVLIRAAPQGLSLVGPIVTVSHVDSGRAIVRTANDEELTVDLAAALVSEPLSAGDRVILERDDLFATEKVPGPPRHERVLEDLDLDTRIEDLPGLEGVFEEILEDVHLHLFKPELAREFHLEPLGGMLLYGDPGCGKTSLARAVGARLGEVSGATVKALLFSPSAHRSKWYGETEERLRRAGQEIREAAQQGARVLAVFDDFDHFGSRDGLQDVDSRVMPALLREIDLIRQCPGVLIMAISNRPDLVDSALTRPGRCGDRRFRIPRPSSRDTAGAILRRYLRSEMPLSTNGCSGAERRDEIVESALSAMFAPNGDLAELAVLHYRDGSRHPLTPAMLLSGALLRAVTQQAGRAAAQRVLQGGPKGLTPADLLDALDRLLAENVAQLRPGPGLAAAIELPAGADVVKIAPRTRRPRLHQHLSEEAS